MAKKMTRLQAEVSQLVGWIRSDDTETQAEGLERLEFLEKRASEATPSIARLVAHSDSVLRYMALNALYRIVGHNTQAAAIVPQLVPALKDSSACVRSGALHVLSRIRKGLPESDVAVVFTSDLRAALAAIAEQDPSDAVKFQAYGLLASVQTPEELAEDATRSDASECTRGSEGPSQNRCYTARIVRTVPVKEDPRGFALYGHLGVIATNEAEAEALVEQHLSERKSLGFSEREIRKKNPRRTPWVPGLRILYLTGGYLDTNGRPFGVESDDQPEAPNDIPF